MGFFVLCAQGQVFITFGDGFVIHWDAATGADRNITIRTRENAADVRVAEGHQSPIISLDVSLDGSRLLSADTSGRVILWRIGEPAEAALPEPRLVVVGDDLLVQNLVAGTTLYVQQDNELTFADPAIKGPFTVQDSSFRLTNVLAGDRQAFPLQFYRALVSREPIFEFPDAHFIGRLRLDDGSLSNMNNSTWLVSGQTYQAQSSTVEVPNLFPGDHDVRVFHRPGNRWEVSELWAEITVSLNSGNNDWSVRRNQPYVLGYSLIDPADGLPAVELEQQDPFIVRSRVKNPSDQAKEVRISYVYARNPLNGPEVPSFQAATTTIPAGETLTLEWNQTFASVGAYSDAMMVETLLDDWYADQYPGGNVKDPEGPASGMERILRGGSYLFDARSSRSAIRFRQGPLDAGNDRGFRVAVRKLSN